MSDFWVTVYFLSYFLHLFFRRYVSFNETISAPTDNSDDFFVLRFLLFFLLLDSLLNESLLGNSAWKIFNVGA